MEKSNSRSKRNILQSILVLYITVWTISPPLQIDAIYRIAALGAVGLWFLLNIPYNVKLERIHVLSIVFAMLVLIVALMESDGKWSHVLRPINYYLLVIAFIMAHCYKERWEELSWIVPIVLLLLTFFNYQTYKTVIDDPSIARIIVRNDPSAYHYLRQGVGGYGLLYSQVCMLPIIVSWIISSFKKNWFRFIVGILWGISYYLYLFNSGYSIAVVASIAGLIILFFYRRSSVVLAIIITTILIALLVWLIGYNTGFREWLINVFDGTKVAKKINDIYLSITTKDTADSIMARAEAYQNSLNSLLSYPLIGGLWFPGGGGGGHSALLDSFAKYGVFGGYVFTKMIFGFSLARKKTPEIGKDIRMANATFIVLLMILLLDSMPYNFVCLIMFVIPICYNDILKWRKKPDENTVDSKSAPERSLIKTGNTV